MAILLLAACLVVRARAGLWTAPTSDRVVRVATWALTVALALAALTNFAASTNVERFVIAPFVLALALLALVVARSGDRRHHIHRHGAQPSH